MFTSRKSQFRRLFERAQHAARGTGAGDDRGGERPRGRRRLGPDAGLRLPASPPRRRSSGSRRWTWACRSAWRTTTRFVRFVGAARAKEIIIGWRRYPAAEALALGLVNEVHPGARLAEATRLCRAPRRRSPSVRMAEMKARINAHRPHRRPRGQRDDGRLPRPCVKLAWTAKRVASLVAPEAPRRYSGRASPSRRR